MPKLILGLGNPGETYRETRHNVGFKVVEELARRWRLGLDLLECNSFVARPAGSADSTASADPEDGETAWLALPQTYMNRSGYAARCLVERFGFEPEAILVVYDEVNLPLGRLRLRKSGSPAGHRGLESILENLRTDQIPRLRLGVAGPDGPPPGPGLPDFVLAPFEEAERETVGEMVARAADACEAWLREGADAAMNRFNR
ncbi:MAG TPA: aminoacyl-tRNA hydrolase [Thermoanaerobaculia bacterium]|jgi:PTH1 family peptidyl-tRNA hydrolase|nr:aminoacyl-tRNA hydrolase [Thermoanaerobaculia bacterium]